MNKSQQSGSVLIIAVITALVLVVGAGAAYYVTDGFGQNKTEEKDDKVTKVDKQAVKDEQTNKSATGADTLPLVKLALDGQGSVECVSKAIINDKHTVSTMYIKDENNILMRIRSDSGTLNSLFKDKTHSYTWSEGKDRGTKAPLNKDDRSVEDQWQENLDDAKTDTDQISCKQTAVKNSLFKVPSSVTFSDISKYVN